jgi:hypothetical protein
MPDIPKEWIREKTTVEDVLMDWRQRRKKHNWWTPPAPEWAREWEAFVQSIQDGDELFRFSACPQRWPEGAKKEGYIIFRGGVPVRTIYFVGDESDYAPKA